MGALSPIMLFHNFRLRTQTAERGPSSNSIGAPKHGQGSHSSGDLAPAGQIRYSSEPTVWAQTKEMWAVLADHEKDYWRDQRQAMLLQAKAQAALCRVRASQQEDPHDEICAADCGEVGAGALVPGQGELCTGDSPGDAGALEHWVRAGFALPGLRTTAAGQTEAADAVCFPMSTGAPQKVLTQQLCYQVNTTTVPDNQL